MDSYRTYTLKTFWKSLEGKEVLAKRRYSHFEWLREMLLKEYESCAVPILPDKSVWEKIIYKNDSGFVKERIRKLQHFFTIIISHPVLKDAKVVKLFLTENDEVNINLFNSFSSLIKI
jgi:hypothetical protein